jgi:methionyl aminopeptidase
MSRERMVKFTLKSADDLAKMREAGKAVAAALKAMKDAAQPGVSTLDLDELAGEILAGFGAVSALKNYQPPFSDIKYLHNSCISINNEVLHGVPKADRIIRDGDVVKLDIAATFDGWCADSAITTIVGTPKTPKAEKLVSVTRASLYNAIRKAIVGNTMGDVSHAIQSHVEKNGFGVVRDLVGHGIGQTPHEEGLDVPCYGRPKLGPKLVVGMTFCIEPMVTTGRGTVAHTGDDPWTITSADRTLGAHFEHTVAILEDGPLILTAAERPDDASPAQDA